MNAPAPPTQVNLHQLLRAVVMPLYVIATVIPFFFYIRIVRAVGPAKAAYSSVLIPILAMAISTVAEGYRWSTLAVAGGILAIAGLIVALSTGRLLAPAPPD